MAQPKKEAAAPAPAPVDDGLVLVWKDGQELRVHPTCLQAHLNRGWKLVS